MLAFTYLLTLSASISASCHSLRHSTYLLVSDLPSSAMPSCIHFPAGVNTPKFLRAQQRELLCEKPKIRVFQTLSRASDSACVHTGASSASVVSDCPSPHCLLKADFSVTVQHSSSASPSLYDDDAEPRRVEACDRLFEPGTGRFPVLPAPVTRMGFCTLPDTSVAAMFRCSALTIPLRDDYLAITVSARGQHTHEKVLNQSDDSIIVWVHLRSAL